jgi:hypothetical protein
MDSKRISLLWASTRFLQLVSNAQSTVGSEVHTKSALDWLSCANRNGPNTCKIVSLEVPEMHNWSEPHKQNWCPVNYHADAIDETIEWRMRIQPWKTKWLIKNRISSSKHIDMI